jgi:serine/threonine protein phosphatase PrpC
MAGRNQPPSLFKRIFSRETVPSPDRAATAPLDPRSLDDHIRNEKHEHVAVGAANAGGVERSQNDDSLLVLTGGADGYDGLQDFGIFCVADGLGGYEHGQTASSIAIRMVASRITQGALLRLLEVDPIEDDQPLEELMRQAFQEANLAVIERAEGGATTLTAVLLLGDYLMIGHVGDTRAYIVKDDDVEQLTLDHSLVRQLIGTGAISEEEALESPHRGVLWNAMGKTEEIQIDVSARSVPRGDYLLLCSDGLWGVLPEHELQQVIEEAESPQSACETLVQAAKDAGATDDVTTILVRFPPETRKPL